MCWHCNCLLTFGQLNRKLYQKDIMHKHIVESETINPELESRTGKVKYALLGWLIGLPLPIILILLFVRGCDF